MKRLTQNEKASLILIFAFIFGAWFRIMPAWMAGFPISDGGMFYTMILDLQKNGYAPPLFTSYNQLNIPFAYPPLGFYIGAFLNDFFDIPVIEILRWLPGIVNAFTLPAFYFFAKAILKDKFQTALAVLVFAFIPHLTSWNGMGGGLTRSFGMFFMLLTLGYASRMFETGAKKFIPGAAVFGGLTVLSHTEAPIYAIVIALALWLVKSRQWKGLLDGIMVAAGVLLIGGGWYGMVFLRHGLSPFQSISQTGAHSFLSIFKILNIAALTEEPYLGLLGALGTLGIASLILKKEYFIPLMMIVIFIVQPRSAHMAGNIPLAMAAGFFAAEILLPAVSRLGERKTAFIFILAVYALGNSLFYATDLSKRILQPSEQAAMLWVKENTPKESAFLVISGDPNAFCDPITEWFPALAKRKSVTTIQGTEWLFFDAFNGYALQSHRVQACIDEGLDCLNREAEALGKPFDYVYVSISPATKNCELADSTSFTTRGLILSLEDSPAYEKVHQSSGAVIFEKRKK